jgi:NADPH:quinone reductase-like Zn-dependent oxidoreductase
MLARHSSVRVKVLHVVSRVIPEVNPLKDIFMSRQTMQAMRVHQFGEPEQLRLEAIARPEPQEGEVLVKVYAAGVLPAEWKVRQGLFQRYQPVSLPYIPGSAFAGVIAGVGPGVVAFQPGQAVFGRSAHGAYAEYTTVNIETIALKPANLSFDEAASISGGATVAWTALFENGDVQTGQKVLIHAAAGGVGLFAVQFASLQGAQVLATAGTSNQDFVRSLGADTVIDYTSTPFEEVAHEVDMVLDTIGGETLRRSLSVVKPGGIVVSLLELPSQERAQELGIRAMKNAVTFPFPSTNLLQTIAQLISAGRVKVVLERIFALDQAALAHQLSQTGHGRGRIILHIAD